MFGCVADVGLSLNFNSYHYNKKLTHSNMNQRSFKVLETLDTNANYTHSSPSMYPTFLTAVEFCLWLWPTYKHSLQNSNTIVISNRLLECKFRTTQNLMNCSRRVHTTIPAVSR